MNNPKRYDTASIEERISIFESRFAELVARYSDFSDVIKQLNGRIDEHLLNGAQMLEIAREEQESVNHKKGLAALFAKRNQGRINAKTLGAIERNFAILKDVQEITARNLELIHNTGVAVRRDVRELMDSIVQTIQVFQQSTSVSLQFQGDDIEMLKQLVAQQRLKQSHKTENSNPSDV